jgi:urea transporter
MGALIFIALSLGSIRLGSKVARLLGRNRDGEVFGGILGFLGLLILVVLIFHLGLIPKKVVASQLECPWLKGCS